VPPTPWPDGWRRGAFRFVARHRRAGWAQRLAGAATAFLAAYGNDDGNLAHDGELDLLHRLAALQPQVVLDVGAHQGEWSSAAAQALPTATIFAVEPAPPSLRVLRERTAGHSRIHVIDRALGERAGRASLAYDPRHSSMATLVPAESRSAAQSFEVTVTTGDQLLAGEGLEVVDLLKIDAEGSDLAVLRGFGGALDAGRIRVVQFEVSAWNAVAGVWLRDFVDILVPAGFLLGRIYPGYVERIDYGYWHEDFRHRGNIVAVKADDRSAALLFAGDPPDG
jgi:FkbM family methyltransferase